LLGRIDDEPGLCDGNHLLTQEAKLRGGAAVNLASPLRAAAHVLGVGQAP
jgi:hypothetical protein